MIRVSGYISEELNSDIKDIAKRENRKFTPMISLLLQLAVKEKNRKRFAKKDNSSYNTSDTRSGNAG